MTPVAITIRYPELIDFVRSIIQGSAAVSPHKDRRSDHERAALITKIEREVVELLQPYSDGKSLTSPMEAHVTIART